MSRQPIFNLPRVVVGLVGVLAVVHAARLALPADTDAHLLAATAFVPGRLTTAFAPDRVAEALLALARTDPTPDGAAAAALFFLGAGTVQPWTVVSYALLHGDWAHLGLNTIWVLAFGSPLAERLGAGRFLLFCVLGAAAGAAAHWAADVVSFQPLIGASAAVSACMGAVVRFGFRRPVAGGRTRAVPIARAPRQPLRVLAGDRRVVAFVLVWLLINFVTGILAVPLGLSAFPIAWQAHVGGFLFGVLALPAFDTVPAAPPFDAGGEDA